MKPKLKPEKHPKEPPYHPVVDFRKLAEFVAELISKERAEQFAFDLSEIDRACNTFRDSTVRLLRALRGAKRNSTVLWDATPGVAGSVHEFKTHGRRVLLTLHKLTMIARSMPPLDKATDLQLTERTLAPLEKLLLPKKATKKRTRRTAKENAKETAVAKRAKKKKTAARRK